MTATHPAHLGKYRITDVLGEGAMGVVYKAYDPRIERVVALKTIRASLSGPDEAVSLARARFRNEAVAAGRLSHPGIVAVYEFDEHDGTAFIVMEFVEGTTLSQLLLQRHVFSDVQVASLMTQLLDALQHAHAHGVWHRDIKPANIIVTPEGRLKVADFGIARLEDAGLTQGRMMIGTPSFMAPEQFTGGTIDRRVDIYGAGVLLYVLLTGRPPFVGPREQIMQRVVHDKAQPPSAVAAVQRPAFYDAVVAKALAKNPEQRYASAAEFRTAIERAGVHDDTTLVEVATVPDPVAVDRLPPEASSFVGRDALVARVAQAAAASRLVTLVGPGGTGKTRVALAAARRAQVGFADGADWIDLSSLPTGADVAARAAQALALAEKPGEALATTLERALAGTRRLLVFDNCEQVLDSARERLSALLAAAPGLHVLATSRQALGLEHEAVIVVPPMLLPIASDGATRQERLGSEAVRLFAARALAHRPSLRLDGDAGDAVLTICERLDGLPLAIELAAARVKLLTPAQIALRLDDAFKVLAGGVPDAQPRQQTLRALFDWSYELLDARERLAFARLAVFRGDFDLDIAEAVLPDAALSRDAVLELIGALVDHSLLGVHDSAQASSHASPREGGAGMRYRYLRTVQRYAAEKLGVDLGLQLRHAGVMLQRANRAATALGGARQAEALSALALDGPNLDAALERCTHERWFGIAVPLASALAALALARGVAIDPVARIEALLAAGPPDSPELALLLQRAGLLTMTLLQRRAQARGWYERGLVLARAEGDRALEATLLRSLAAVAFQARNMAEAETLCQQALAISQALADTLGQALAIDRLGAVALMRGDHDLARGHMQRGIAVFREQGRTVELAKSLHNLAVAEYRAGQHDAAERLLEECIEMQQASGDLRSEVMARAQIGLNRLNRDLHAAAIEPLQAAVARARGLDDTNLLAQCLEHLAAAQSGAGDTAAALATANESLGLRRASENAEDLAESLFSFAELLVTQNPRLSARLLGHADALLARHGVALTPNQRLDVDRIIDSVRARLGERDYAAAHAEGGQRDLDALLRLAGARW